MNIVLKAKISRFLKIVEIFMLPQLKGVKTAI